MTAKKPATGGERGLNPDYVYRKFDPVTLNVIGLGPTQINGAIARGELPPPVKITQSGRARGWLGSQLIELQQKRLAEAQTQTATPDKKPRGRPRAGRDEDTTTSRHS
jgi:predicted DNA-binding transcriptional regulator AlpA